MALYFLVPDKTNVDRLQVGEAVARQACGQGVAVEHAFRGQGHAGAGADAVDNGAPARVADDGRGHVMGVQPVLQGAAVRAAAGPHEQGLVLQISRVQHGRGVGAGNQHQGLAVQGGAFQLRVGVSTATSAPSIR